VFSEILSFRKKKGGGVPDHRFSKFGTTPQFYDGFEMKPVEIMIVSLMMAGLRKFYWSEPERLTWFKKPRSPMSRVALQLVPLCVINEYSCVDWHTF
jgi:hypothetical protein